MREKSHPHRSKELREQTGEEAQETNFQSKGGQLALPLLRDKRGSAAHQNSQTMKKTDKRKLQPNRKVPKDAAGGANFRTGK